MIDWLDDENLFIVENGSEIKLYFSRTNKTTGLTIEPKEDEGEY